MRTTTPLSLLLSVALVGGAALTACEDRTSRDVDELRRELEETKRQAAKDLDEARAKATADIAEKERELAAALNRQVAEEMKDYGYADRTEYRDVRRRELVDLDDEIAKLEREAKQASGEAKREIDEAIVDLRKRRDQLAKDLDRAGDVTEREWNELKRNVDEAFTDIRKNLDDAWNDLKKRT